MKTLTIVSVLAAALSFPAFADMSRDDNWATNGEYALWDHCNQPITIPTAEEVEATSEYVNANMLWANNDQFQVYNWDRNR